MIEVHCMSPLWKINFCKIRNFYNNIRRFVKKNYSCRIIKKIWRVTGWKFVQLKNRPFYTFNENNKRGVMTSYCVTSFRITSHVASVLALKQTKNLDKMKYKFNENMYWGVWHDRYNLLNSNKLYQIAAWKKVDRFKVLENPVGTFIGDKEESTRSWEILINFANTVFNDYF